MFDFEQFIGRDPATLSDQERYRLGIAFYDPSRLKDQKIAMGLGVTASQAIKIAIRVAESGQDIVEWSKLPEDDLLTPFENNEPGN